MRERSILVGLRHPNVVAVRDLVVEGERLAIVMEFVGGGSLRDTLRERGPLRPAVAFRVVGAVLDGLAAAHDRHVLHRDLKPDNVLLASAWQYLGPGAVKLSDFGIAEIVADGTRSSSGLIGTPEYMAPEQLVTGAGDLPADVYGVGILLYELLGGRTPFAGPGTGYAVAHRHVTSEAPRLPVPDPVWDVIAGMLAKDPARRPTARVAAAQLRRLGPTVSDLEAIPAQGTPDDFRSAGGPATELRGLTVPTVGAAAAEGTDTATRRARGRTAARARHAEPGDDAPADAGAADRDDAAALVDRIAFVGLAAAGPSVHRPHRGGRRARRARRLLGRARGRAGRRGADVRAPGPGAAAELRTQFRPRRQPHRDLGGRQPDRAADRDLLRPEGPALRTVPRSAARRRGGRVPGRAVAGRRQPERPVDDRDRRPLRLVGEHRARPGPGQRHGDGHGAARADRVRLDVRLQQWLTSAAAATDAAVSDAEVTSTAFPAQRLVDVNVVGPSRTVSGKTLQISLLPVWPSGPDELHPLFKSPPSGQAAQALVAIAGGTEGVRFSDGCSGALDISKDGLVVVAQSVAQDCQIGARVGNFTDLTSNPFEITTRGS